MRNITRRGLLTGLVAMPLLLPNTALASIGQGFCPPSKRPYGSGAGSLQGGGESGPIEDYSGHVPVEGPPERFLSIRCAHLGDAWSGQYVANGQYISEALEALNFVTKDWRHREPTNMNPYLWDILFDITTMLGLSAPWTINSGYRNPQSNATVGGARQSMHMRGFALDVAHPERTPSAIQGAARALQQQRGRGGVGHYSSFTHVDARGGVSTWYG